jgi:hypothetical protein
MSFSSSVLSRIFVLGVISGFAIGCNGHKDRLDPFAQSVTTSMNVTVKNSSTSQILAKTQVRQMYDANYCKPDFANESSASLNPGQATTISVSIDCNMKVRTYFSAYKDAGYSMAAIRTSKADMAAKMVPGVQFLVYFQDSPIPVTVTVVNPPAIPSGYSYVWPLSPTGSAFVAWMEKIESAQEAPYWLLRFSLAQGSETRNAFVEFDPLSGIDHFGDGFTQDSNGKKRDIVFQTRGPAVSSTISEGTVVCDDFGCIESQP